MSIGNSKFSQSGKGYSSSAVIVLTNTPKISNLNERHICKSFPLRVIKKYHKSALMMISQVFGTH